MRIKTKAIAHGIGSSVVVGLTLGLYMVKLSSDAADHRIAQLERTLRDDFDRNARLEVEAAVSMLKVVSDRAARGDLSLEKAKAEGAELLRNLRYDKDGYFWADTYEGVNVVLHGREPEGKIRLDQRDAKGTFFVREFIRRGRAGGGYTDYWFVRDRHDAELPKRAYTLGFAPFGWIVGTGNYVDDIDDRVALERRSALEHRRRQYMAIALVVLIATAAAAVVSSLLVRAATQSLGALVDKAERLRKSVADGALAAEVEALAAVGAEVQDGSARVEDEVRTLAAAFDRLVRAIGDRERARLQSEDLVRMAFRTSPDAFVLTDMETGRLAAANGGFTRITGWTAEEAVGRTVAELGVWADLGDRARLVEQVVQAGSMQQFESRFRTRDGRFGDALMSAAIVEIDGRPHLLTVTADITWMKRAERALRESEERFRLAFKSSPDAIAISRASDGTYLAVNDGFVQMYGNPEEDVLGRSALDLGIWTSAAERHRMVEAVTRDGETHFEARFRRKDGTLLIGAVSAKSMLLDDVPHLLTVTRDVTRDREAEGHRRQLEADLSRTARDWRDTFDAIESPILLVDAGGRIARLNRSAQRLAGIAYQALIGRPVGLVGSGEPWREASRLAEVVRSSGVIASGQVRDANERSWDVLASTGPGAGPDDQRVVVVARDVTAVVQLEASLRRTEAVSAMGALVAGVAHEVRNPLFAISALLDAMEAQPGGVRAPERYLGALRGEIDRMTRLMRDLLEYGKPSVPDLADREIGEVVAAVAAASSGLATTAGVVLSNQIPAHFALARLDPVRIGQALQNLVQNAVQHSAPGGTVVVEAAASRVDDRSWLDVSVRDSGPGFREEDLPRVFQPFFSRRRGGTGLGLSIVQSIVDAHGGRVRAANGPGGGAVVTLSLPLPAHGAGSR